MEILDEPTTQGLYVVYTDPDWVGHTAERRLLLWVGGKWGYPMSDQNFRGHVYGCIGPLPIMRLED
jgi:hypothetical protein